jgi:hypothetical protein
MRWPPAATLALARPLARSNAPTPSCTTVPANEEEQTAVERCVRWTLPGQIDRPDTEPSQRGTNQKGTWWVPAATNRGAARPAP